MSELRRNRRKQIKEAKKQTLQQAYLGNIDKIVQGCKDIAKAWSLNYIPISTFDELIKISKLAENTEDQKLNDFNKAFNNMVNEWAKLLRKSSENMNTTNVPVANIELTAIELQKLIKESTPTDK